MSSGEDRDSRVPSRAMTGWTVGLVCVAIVAGGVIVGGLLHEREPELTTKPVPASTTATPPVDTSYATPPVVFPVAIPGCAVVEPPSDGATMGFAASASGYDNPKYPWFSGPKAVVMSQALRDVLPGAVEVPFASVDHSLFFGPIFDPPTEPGKSVDFGGWTTASGELLRGGKAGDLMVSVRQSTAPIPPCVAGDLDERRHRADGTIVDVHDTWHEVGKVRTLSRTARAYLADGSAVTAYATDNGQDGSSHSGTVPLTVDDLAAIVTAPGLRVTTPVPPGTPDVPESCGAGSDAGAVIDQAAAHRLDAVLARIPLDGLTLDRPLGQLRPPGFDGNGVCQVVRVTTPGRQSRLSVAIAAGQRLPEESAAVSSPDGERVTTRRQPDGAVVQSRESRTTRSPNEPGMPSISETMRTVTITRRSGAQVQVSSTAEGSIEPLPFEQLEAIAVTPGLEVS
ncbi:hypothetical protein ACQPW1_26995 [Nocardia sp. CA-128927]|uniref:hypothetical protein n=1 Tax=Nocardia sp. CA-128927 TaxID=3239975 RepID=UPI003D99BDDC